MPGYIDRVMKATSILETTLGRKFTADTRVAHDSWCASYKGQDCNCEPEITLHVPDASGSLSIYTVLADGTVQQERKH